MSRIVLFEMAVRCPPPPGETVVCIAGYCSDEREEEISARWERKLTGVDATELRDAAGISG